MIPTWGIVAVATLVGFLVGSSVAVWGAWLAFRDHARRYFRLRGYGADQATREANRALGVEWFDPRDAE